MKVHILPIITKNTDFLSMIWNRSVKILKNCCLKCECCYPDKVLSQKKEKKNTRHQDIFILKVKLVMKSINCHLRAWIGPHHCNPALPTTTWIMGTTTDLKVERSKREERSKRGPERSKLLPNKCHTDRSESRHAGTIRACEKMAHVIFCNYTCSEKLKNQRSKHRFGKCKRPEEIPGKG